MKVKIVNTSKYPLPEYKTSGSAGMDVYANIDNPIMLQSLDRRIIPTGIHIQLPDGYKCDIRPRSGLAAKHGLSICNTPGLIDEDYTGEIKVILINLSKDTYVVQPGERIAQMVINKYEKVEWEEVETLDSTERGDGGFGSTGKK